jgi:hypothetical protein
MDGGAHRASLLAGDRDARSESPLRELYLERMLRGSSERLGGIVQRMTNDLEYG